MSLRYIYIIVEPVEDLWETKAICMQRGIADKLLDKLREFGDDIHYYYMFRVPQDKLFKYPLVSTITNNSELMRDSCFSLKEVKDWSTNDVQG